MAPRLQVLTECFERRIQDHQRVYFRWARNWIKPLTTSTTALSQQHRRRAHHERELAKRRRTRRPLPLRLRHNGNVTKALHATPSSTSSWGRAPTITRLQDLSRIQPCTRRIPRYPNYPDPDSSSSGSSMHPRREAWPSLAKATRIR